MHIIETTKSLPIISNIIKNLQNNGATFILLQKILVSIDLAFFSFSLSNTHILVAYFLTSFHRLKPTSTLPAEFLTNQKSREFNSTKIINIEESLITKIPKNKNKKIAKSLKKLVKKQYLDYVHVVKL